MEHNGENYLSAGEMPLPNLYFLMSFIFFITGCVWITVLRKKRYIFAKFCNDICSSLKLLFLINNFEIIICSFSCSILVFLCVIVIYKCIYFKNYYTYLNWRITVETVLRKVTFNTVLRKVCLEHLETKKNIAQS